MAFKPLRMDKRELIHQYSGQHYAIKKIARILGLSKNTVKKYLRKQDDQNKSEFTIDALEDLNEKANKGYLVN